MRTEGLLWVSWRVSWRNVWELARCAYSLSSWHSQSEKQSMDRKACGSLCGRLKVRFGEVLISIVLYDSSNLSALLSIPI